MSIDQSVLDKFEAVVESQRKRIMDMKEQDDFIDYSKLDKLIIGVCGGDGIGPTITHEAERVLRFLLKDEVERGKVAFKEIDGLTIENRAAHMKAIPDDVLAELKACHVILKGPTTTPRAGDEWPNIESANVAMRKELDLFANVRPVKVPEEGIDWTFFRENTEGAYTLGSCGFETEDGISVDFTITTTDGTQRIAELAYDFARKNHKTRVSIVTKANIIKATDGKFLKLCQAVGEKYPEGTILEGVIKNITEFGMFIGIEDGIDGLIHVSDISWTKKIRHPNELFKVGDTVQAKVLTVDQESEKFTLGIKQLTEDPWTNVPTAYPVGGLVKGIITNITDFGLFVEVEEGIEGLVHVSELSNKKVKTPAELYKEGEEIQAKIIHVSAEDRRLGLSIKQLKDEEERKKPREYSRSGPEAGQSLGDLLKQKFEESEN